MEVPSSARPQRILIIGAGGHGRVIADIVARQYVEVPVAFLDDLRVGTRIDGVPVLGRPKDLGSILMRWTGICTGVIVGVGENVARARLVQAASAVMEVPMSSFVPAVDPSAVVSPRAVIGVGTVVMANVAVNTGTVVGAHAILNTGCGVDHDCRVGEFAHISPGVHLAGGVTIAEGAHVGVGSSVIPGVKIGAWSIIGAGSAVVRDLPDQVVAYGVPARVRRRLGERSTGG